MNLIYFFLYLFIEVMISSSIAGIIGGLWVFLEIITTATVGIFILRNFKFSLLESISQVTKGEITHDEFIKTNVAKALGAALLIVPGFFTDILGVALQFGFLTILFAKIFHFKPQNNSYENHNNFHFNQFNSQNFTRRENNEDIIDVEIIDDNKSIKH